MNHTDNLLTVTQAAEALGVTTSCIRRWVLERRISTVKLGRLVRISEGELARIIDAGARPAVGVRLGGGAL